MSNGQDEIYTFDEFLRTAQRRSREARSLLEHPTGQKQRDGAVTMALIAAECALKAVLLHGFQLNTSAEVDEAQKWWFRGKTGHNLGLLWNGQPAHVRALSEPGLDDALRVLCPADPYSYRYGKKKPKDMHAEPFVEGSELLVKWSQKIVLGASQ